MNTLTAIDTHAHLWKNPKGLDALVASEKIEQVWLMEISYYRGSTLKDLASADEILEVSRRYPGFFIPFGFVDFSLGPDQVDRMKERGFVGLKAIRPALPYDDPTYFPIYERAEALNMPLLFHVGIILKNTRDEMTPHQSIGPTNMRPSMLDAIAAAFPNLTVLAGHMGFPWLDELFETLYYYPNVYCTLCGHIDYRWLIDHLDRRCVTDDGKLETICERMLFATDHIYGRDEQAREKPERFANFIEDFILNAGTTHIWGTKGDKVLSETARKIMTEIMRKNP